MKDNPLVSIIIPVYNGADYMREAINSALAQTYSNIEVLVINDGSSDEGMTERIALEYGNRIRYFRKENGGVASALNLGVKMMTGDYFSWLSHDDVYLPNRVERLISFLSTLKDRNAIVFSGYQTINEAGKVLEVFHLPSRVYNNIPGLIAIDTERTLNGCTMLIPRNLLEENPFDESLRYTQDYDLWRRLVKIVPFVYLDECLFQSRQHPMQDSRSGGERVLVEADRFRCQSVCDLTPDQALAYVDDHIQELQKYESTYQANGYEATALAIRDLIRKCHIIRSKESAASAWVSNLRISKSSRNFDSLLTPENRETVVFYSNVWTFGGIERVLSKLIPELQKTRRVVLVSNFVPNEKGYSLPSETIHILLDEDSENSLPERLVSLARLAGAFTFIGNPNIVAEFLPTYKLMNRSGIKTIALNHYYYFLPYSLPWLKPIAELRHEAFQYTDAVVWLTSFSACMCAMRSKNTAVIPNPNTYSSTTPRAYPKDKTILVVGRFFDSLKRIDRIMQVFGAVYRKDSSVRLVVLGNCHGLDDYIPAPVGKSIRAAMNDAGVPKSAVEFAGEQLDVRPYYEQASLLLLASECEGFAMVLTEAGVLGVPVLVYGTPGLEDIITEPENGFIVPEGEIETAAERILSVIGDESCWLKMSRSAQKLAERFALDKVMEKWLKLLDLLHDQDRRPMPEKIENAGLSFRKTIPVNDMYVALNEQKRVLLSAYSEHASIPVSAVGTGGAFGSASASIDDAYRREVLAMQKSLSWRITAPLRWLKRLFHKSK